MLFSSREIGVTGLSDSESPAAAAATATATATVGASAMETARGSPAAIVTATTAEEQVTGSAGEDGGGAVVTVRLPSPAVTVQHSDSSEPTLFEQGDESSLSQEGGEGRHTYA